MRVLIRASLVFSFFFFQAEDGIRDADVTGVQTCALPISLLRTRFTQPTRSLGPLVVSYSTVSPLPRSSFPKERRPWRSAFCCTFSRVAPGGDRKSVV